MRTALESFWITTSPNRSQKRFPKLTGTKRFNVAIVGGGITGLSSALLLKQTGRSVAVIEQNEIGSGDTARTTAHLTEAVDARYHFLISKFGIEAARLVAQSSRAAIDKISQWIETHSIDCDFERVPGYFYSERRAQGRQVKRECEAMKKAGLRASLVKHMPLPFGVSTTLKIEDQAQFHPIRYVQALADLVAGGGCEIFEHSHVEEIKEWNPCVIRTEDGTIEADEVIIATHSPISTRYFIHPKMASYRTYAVAGPSSIDPPLLPALYWDTDEPYHYIRTQRVGADLYLIIGGADHKTGKTGDSFSKIEEYARRKFGLDRITNRWSGQVLEPMDGLPYIGRNPASEKILIATGFSGNGMTFGTVAAMILSDIVLGRPNPWAELYRSTRIRPLAGAKDFFRENIDYPLCLIEDRIRPAEATRLAEVAPGEGKIVEVNGRKLAVHRTDDGQIQALSPICTHLGCHVRWNGNEKSWDCPCHGSRFATTGEVLNGPALSGLERVRIKEAKGGKKEAA